MLKSIINWIKLFFTRCEGEVYINRKSTMPSDYMEGEVYVKR